MARPRRQPAVDRVLPVVGASWRGNLTIFPPEQGAAKTLRRWDGMYQEWIAGIKTSDPDRPSCPFSYAGPLTEAYLLGNIAMKVGQEIEWDAKNLRITNCEAANQYLKREYRKGWEL